MGASSGCQSDCHARDHGASLSHSSTIITTTGTSVATDGGYWCNGIEAKEPLSELKQHQEAQLVTHFSGRAYVRFLLEAAPCLSDSSAFSLFQICIYRFQSMLRCLLTPTAAAYCLSPIVHEEVYSRHFFVFSILDKKRAKFLDHSINYSGKGLRCRIES